MVIGKRDIATVVAEFLGTGVLTLLVLSVARSAIGQYSYFIAAAAGLAIALMVFSIGKISGGYFNPALTLGFWTARKIPTVNAVLYIAAQFLGAWAAYHLYIYLLKLPNLPNVGGEYAPRILVAEAVGTAIFGFGVAAAVYQKASQAVIASFAGISLMLGIVVASSAAAGLLNPAVALGVKAWVWNTYILGPVLGAIVGVNLYAMVFSDEGVLSESAVKVSKASTSKPAKKKPAKKSSRAKK